MEHSIGIFFSWNKAKCAVKVPLSVKAGFHYKQLSINGNSCTHKELHCGYYPRQSSHVLLGGGAFAG
jgi:hypothetical protein